MTGRNIADIFEEDRLPPFFMRLKQKHSIVTDQLDALPVLPNARESSVEVCVYACNCHTVVIDRVPTQVSFHPEIGRMWLSVLFGVERITLLAKVLLRKLKGLIWKVLFSVAALTAINKQLHHSSASMLHCNILQSHTSGCCAVWRTVADVL